MLVQNVTNTPTKGEDAVAEGVFCVHIRRLHAVDLVRLNMVVKGVSGEIADYRPPEEKDGWSAQEPVKWRNLYNPSLIWPDTLVHAVAGRCLETQADGLTCGSSSSIFGESRVEISKVASMSTSKHQRNQATVSSSILSKVPRPLSGPLCTAGTGGGMAGSF